MAGDDALSDEQVHNFVEQLEVCRSLDDDKRVVLAAARLAQQRERERLVTAAEDLLDERRPRPRIMYVGVDQRFAHEALAALQARHEAEVRDLRAAAEDAVPWETANEALKWLVKFGRTEHSSALLEICDGSTVELLDCIGRLRAALSTKAGGA
jgi:chromatin segregation and condensation protein Rec8/ScpA/Scc1 (kleisin family)